MDHAQNGCNKCCALKMEGPKALIFYYTTPLPCWPGFEFIKLDHK